MPAMHPLAKLLPGILLFTLAACERSAETTPPVAPTIAAEPAGATKPDTPQKAATANASTETTDGKLRLTGTFEIKSTRWGEAWTALDFDDVALSMENERVIRVSGRGTPAIDSAIDAIESINVETTSPEGKRLLDACNSGCTIEGTIVEFERGEWQLETLSNVVQTPTAPSLNVGEGDPRRKALLDALRPVIEKDLGQSVQFVVDVLRERDGSAFAVVHPRTSKNKPIDFAKTKHAQRQEDGVLDGDTIYAILQSRNGAWTLTEFVIGPTDVAWTNWAKDYNAPEAIFLDNAE